MNTQREDLAPSRRRRYTARPWLQDYFVVSHLASLLHSRLAEYVRPGARVADIGCGEQPLRKTIEALGAHYVGIDVVQNTSQSVDVVAPISAVPLPDDSLDVIVCTEVLEHISDTSAAVREIARLLAAGGVAIITTPFCYPLHEEPFDFVRLTVHQVRALTAGANLEITELLITGNEFEVLATILDNLVSRVHSGRRGPLLRAGTALTRVVVNGLTMGLSALVGRMLPQRSYLHTFCVARWSGASAP